MLGCVCDQCRSVTAGSEDVKRQPYQGASARYCFVFASPDDGEFSLIQLKILFGVLFLPIVYYAESRQTNLFGNFVDG